jgi:hypothetical protein
MAVGLLIAPAKVVDSRQAGVALSGRFLSTLAADQET